ncbi:MAG: two-component sensor histidine kinase [Leptospiraceae bacterium]|nr:two-component sensor histidine kinase [Leptospiraceae bacterium]
MLILLITGGTTFGISSFVELNLKIILIFFFALFSLFLTFHFSYSLASSVTTQLKVLQEKASAVNAGETSSTLVMTNIQELADLSKEIDLMSRRLSQQFYDLNLEKEKFNFVLQSLKEGVFAIDKTKTILFQNRSVPTSLIPENSGMRKINTVITHPKFLEFLNDHIEKDKEGKILLECNKKYYSVRLYNLQANPDYPLFIGVISDKTEERERQIMREQFVQSASHELKTPITSIKGYTETLEKKLSFLPGNSNEKKFLNAIKRNTERMIRIVEDMLTISKLENANTTIQREEFLILELVDRLQMTLGGILSTKNQKFITQIPSDLEIYADPILLEHLLLNLIQNASMYSPNNKNIYLKVERFSDRICRLYIMPTSVADFYGIIGTRSITHRFHSSSHAV